MSVLGSGELRTLTRLISYSSEKRGGLDRLTIIVDESNLIVTHQPAKP
jgi:hypothetical protein